MKSGSISETSESMLAKWASTWGWSGCRLETSESTSEK